LIKELELEFSSEEDEDNSSGLFGLFSQALKKNAVDKNRKKEGY